MLYFESELINALAPAESNKKPFLENLAAKVPVDNSVHVIPSANPNSPL